RRRRPRWRAGIAWSDRGCGPALGAGPRWSRCPPYGWSWQLLSRATHPARRRTAGPQLHISGRETCSPRPLPEKRKQGTGADEEAVQPSALYSASGATAPAAIRPSSVITTEKALLDSSRPLPHVPDT